MKKKFLFLVVGMIIMLMGTAFASQEAIEVQLNGEYIDFTDEFGNKVNPELINDRTMVPMRKIFETLGMEVLWSPSSRTVTARNEDKTITLAIDSTLATVTSGEETKNITLDAAPVLFNDRTMVPVRFIAESLEKQVGWDEKNRVVVIIDYTDLLEDLEEECSNYLAMTKEQTVTIDTFDLDFDFEGKLDYKDLEDRKKNQTINLDGTMNMKKSEDKLAISFEANMKGNGLLYEAIKQNDFDSFTCDIILDEAENMMYINSSLLKEETNGKWVKGPITTNSNLLDELNQLGKNQVDFKEMFVLSEESLTKDSYEELQKVVTLFKKIFGNDAIKVSGTTTKTYTVRFDLLDVLSQFVQDEDTLAGLSELGALNMEIKNTYKKGMNTKTELKLTLNMQNTESEEKVAFTFGGTGAFKSYNKPVTVTLPKASNTMDINE